MTQMDYLKIGGALLYMLFEYFLGKTDLVKSGSLIELLLNMALFVLRMLGIAKPQLEEKKQ